MVQWYQFTPVRDGENEVSIKSAIQFQVCSLGCFCCMDSSDPWLQVCFRGGPGILPDAELSTRLDSMGDLDTLSDVCSLESSELAQSPCARHMDSRHHVGTDGPAEDASGSLQLTHLRLGEMHQDALLHNKSLAVISENDIGDEREILSPWQFQRDGACCYPSPTAESGAAKELKSELKGSRSSHSTATAQLGSGVVDYFLLIGWYFVSCSDLCVGNNVCPRSILYS